MIKYLDRLRFSSKITSEKTSFTSRRRSNNKMRTNQSLGALKMLLLKASKEEPRKFGRRGVQTGEYIKRSSERVLSKFI